MEDYGSMSVYVVFEDAESEKKVGLYSNESGGMICYFVGTWQLSSCHRGLKIIQTSNIYSLRIFLIKKYKRDSAQSLPHPHAKYKYQQIIRECGIQMRNKVW